MVSRLAFVSVVLAAFVCASVMGAEEAKGQAKPKKYVGKLSAKPADAPAEVVAVLTCAARAKKDVKAEEKVYKLTATGDVATKLTDLAAKGAQVQVTGTEAGDTIAVTEVEEKAAKAEGQKREGRRKGGGQ
mgnify:CR=1 FL=1